jgi:hypothetical protein
MTASALYVGNTSVLVVSGVKDRAGVAITGATVQLVELVDNRGRAVTGITLPITCDHIDAGTYEGEIPADLDIRAGSVYRATVTATASGVTAEWEETLIAQKRHA